MLIAGIDIGAKGAIAILDQNRQIIHTCPLPQKNKKLDFYLFQKTLNKFPIDSFVIEEVFGVPRQSSKSTFSFGRNFGYIEAIVALTNKPYILTPARSWQALFHKGIHYHMTAKEKSLTAFKRLFPNCLSLAKTKRGAIHDGIIDAVLISTYGLLRCKFTNKNT
jgi:hypothetical protein